MATSQMPKPQKYWLEISDDEFIEQLGKWKEHYLELMEYLSEREEIMRSISDKLKLWLPIRRELVQSLAETIQKLEKDSNLNIFAKTATTTFTKLYNLAVWMGTLGHSSTGNTIIVTADLAEEIFKYGEENATLEKIRNLLEKEKELAKSFCDSAKDLEEMRKKIKKRQFEYYQLTVARIFSRLEIYSTVCGESLSEKEKEAEKEIFFLGKSLSSVYSATRKVGEAILEGLTPESSMLFLDRASKGDVTTLAPGNVLISIFEEKDFAKEFPNRSEFLYCLRDDHSSLERETSMPFNAKRSAR